MGHAVAAALSVSNNSIHALRQRLLGINSKIGRI
jgi:hypothetical protein